MAKISIERSYVISEPIGDGSKHTATLQSRLWNNLDQIEQVYGPRDASWTIMGVEFYPIVGHIQFCAGRRLLVRIPLETMDDETETFHYLAHEAVHCLAPDPSFEQATVLEEGLCEAFAVDHVKMYYGTKIKCQSSHYKRAEFMARILIALGGGPEVIRKLRTIEPCFHKIRVEHLRAVAPTIDRQFAADLLAPLYQEGEFEREAAAGHFTPADPDPASEAMRQRLAARR